MSKKKRLIIAAAALIVLACALLFILLQNGFVKLSSKEDTLVYGYRPGNKAIQVEIRGEFPEGYEWSMVRDDAEQKLSAAGSHKNKIRYKVTQENGEQSFAVRFILQKDGSIPDIKRILDYYFYTDENGKLVCSEVASRLFLSTESHEVDSEYPYTLGFAESGALLMELEREEGGSWRCWPADPVNFRVEEETDQDAGKQLFRIYAIRYGIEGDFCLYCPESGTVLTFALSADPFGHLLLTPGKRCELLSEEAYRDTVAARGYDEERIAYFLSPEDFKMVLSIGGEEYLTAYLDSCGITEDMLLPDSTQEYAPAGEYPEESTEEPSSLAEEAEG